MQPKAANATSDARDSAATQSASSIVRSGQGALEGWWGSPLNVHKDITAEDRLAAKRLTGLLDYVDALVRLDERVATRLSQHKLADGSQFILHQHELASLPGTKYDIADRDGPIWLRIQRLQRSKSPEVAEEQRPWIDVSNDPACLPVLRDTLRPFEKPAGSRFALAEDAARRCMRSLEGPDSEGISPFRQDSFEPILKICGSQLDPEGRYLPDHESLPATGAVPEQVGESLVVSDRYVLYARRRSSNSILRDIDQLKNAISSEALVQCT
jgi:hypothetical protein